MFFGLKTLESLAPIDKVFKTRAEAFFDLQKCAVGQRVFRACAVFLRGRRGQGRVSLMVLLHYVLSLATLGASAILFWALMFRLLMNPGQRQSLRVCLAVVLAHFFPGLSHTELSIPTWAQVGPALTAWVLFVLYVGPAASLLPVKQDAYVKKVSTYYTTLRKAMHTFKVHGEILKIKFDKLPKA